MTRWYEEVITKIDPNVNPLGVEGSMRLEYGTLDHLGKETFRQEILIARQCEIEDPGYLRRVAESYGSAKEFDRWEKAHPTINCHRCHDDTPRSEEGQMRYFGKIVSMCRPCYQTVNSKIKAAGKGAK